MYGFFLPYTLRKQANSFLFVFKVILNFKKSFIFRAFAYYCRRLDLYTDRSFNILPGQLRGIFQKEPYRGGEFEPYLGRAGNLNRKCQVLSVELVPVF